MSDRQRLRWVFPGLFLVVLAGCAGLASRAEPPHVSMANLQVVSVGLFEQRYRLQLRVQNPNDFSLPIAGLSYHLYINDQDFGRGVSRQSVTIPGFGEELLDVEVVSDLGSVLQQIRELGEGARPSLRYRLAGSVSLADRFGRLPFEYKGEIDFGGMAAPYEPR